MTEGTGTGTGTGDPKPWYDGKITDSEVIGHIQNRGWHNKPLEEVAIAAIQSHREAEKHLGVPADRLIRLPANLGDQEAMKPVWQKLGAPADPKEYDFSTVKNAKGEDIAQPLADVIRSTAAANNLPKTAAAALAAAVVKHQDGIEAEAAANKTAAVQKEKETLAKEWGPNATAHREIAKAGARKLGFTPEQVDALEGVVGYAGIMKALHQVGVISGEAKPYGLDNNNNNQPGLLTYDQAVARKAELMADQEWSKRYLAGGSAEGREMTALIQIISRGKSA